jgi:hypothetical protein
MSGLKSDHGWSRDAVRAGRRWVSDHRLVLSVGLVAASPVIVSTVGALVDGWTPVFDDAIIATRSFDVFSAHSPLVGTLSDASVPSVGWVYGAGPLLYWLLALQARFLGDWALPVTMGVVNTASIMGVVALARRRGGHVLMFATAVAVVVMYRSLPQAMLHEIDNSRAGVVAFTLLLFLGWSVACGEYRLLPLTVLVASLVVQVHFSLALPGVVVLVVAMAGLARSHAGRESDPSVARDRRRWLLGALLVAVVCWSAPLLDQALHSPGNLSRIVQTATAQKKTAGMSVGWHALVRAIGVPPRWLRTYSSGGEVRDLLSAPNRVAIASSVLILGALLVVGLVGLRRRRNDVVAGAALALAVSASIVVVAASLAGLTVFRDYALRWSSPAGMFVWLVLGWSLTALLRPASWPAVRRTRTLAVVRRPAIVPVSLLALTAILAGVAATGPVSDSDTLPWAYRPARAVTSLLPGRLPRQQAVEVRGSSFLAYTFETAIIYSLRRDGYRVVAPSEDAALDLSERLGSYYSPGGLGATPRRYDDVLLVDLANAPVTGGRVIARVALHGAPALGQPAPTMMTVVVSSAPPEQVATVCPAAAPAAPYGPAIQQLRISPGHVTGSIDASQIVGASVRLCGWAANVNDRHVADSVLVFSDGRFIAAVKPTISRPDVARVHAGVGADSGFSIQLPLSTVEHHGQKAKVQIFGIERGIASPLPLPCASKPQDFGC